jgi:uncharacterized protein
MVMAGLVFDVTELVSRPDATLRIHRSVSVPGLSGPLGSIEENEPVEIDLTVDPVTEGVAVGGTVSGTMHLSCSRCLIGYDRSFTQRLDEVYYFEGAEDHDGYELVDNQIDLEPMLRDVIMLAFPLRPLHDEECLGLCATCGADRNAGDCGHTQEPEDLRWAPLRALATPLGDPDLTNVERSS